MSYILGVSHSPLYFFGLTKWLLEKKMAHGANYWGFVSSLWRLQSCKWSWILQDHSLSLLVIRSPYKILLKRGGLIFFLSERSKRKQGTKDCQSRPSMIHMLEKGQTTTIITSDLRAVWCLIDSPISGTENFRSLFRNPDQNQVTGNLYNQNCQSVWRTKQNGISELA